MASASASNAARLCLAVCQRAPRIAPIQRVRWSGAKQSVVQSHRALSTSSSRWARSPDEDGEQDDKVLRDEDDAEDVYDSATGEEKFASGYDNVKIPDRIAASMAKLNPDHMRMMDEVAKESGFDDFDSMAGGEANFARDMDRQFDKDFETIALSKNADKQSMWFDDEEPEENWNEEEEFEDNDITHMAHGRLDEVREMRHYARLAVWELPLLSKLAKPFEPPTDKQVLRWRYTTYMGEAHPAEKKVVVQFAPDDLKLSPVQTDKLKKLAGARYNPETELVKMSCESFAHPAQNKRHLATLVNDLIAAAKDPSDTFSDVPLDTRHHQFKKRPKFPREWHLTPERKQEIEDYRRRTALSDLDKAEKGTLVDGKQKIDEYLMQQIAEGEKSSTTKDAGRVFEQEKVEMLLARTERQRGVGRRVKM